MEPRDGIYYVRVKVPRSQRTLIGHDEIRPLLHTSCRAGANRLEYRVIAGVKG